MSPFFRGSVRPAKKHPRAWSTNPRLNPDLNKEEPARLSILGLPSQPTDVLLPVFNGVYYKPSGTELIEEEDAQYELSREESNGQHFILQSQRQQQQQPPQPAAVIQNVAQRRSTTLKRTEAAAQELAAHKPHVAEIVLDETAHVPASAATVNRTQRAETLLVEPDYAPATGHAGAGQDVSTSPVVVDSLKNAPTFAVQMQNPSNQSSSTGNNNGQGDNNPLEPAQNLKSPGQEPGDWPLPAAPVALSSADTRSNQIGKELSGATPQAAVSEDKNQDSLASRSTRTLANARNVKTAAPELEAVGVTRQPSPVPTLAQQQQQQSALDKTTEHEAAAAATSPVEPETIDGPALVKASPLEQMTPITEEPQPDAGAAGEAFEDAVSSQPPPAPVEHASLAVIAEEESSKPNAAQEEDAEISTEQPHMPEEDTSSFDADELRGAVNHQSTAGTASATSSAGTLTGHELPVKVEQLKLGGEEFRPSVNVVS
ncbi:hypothetical protein BD289DRAFT_451561 [Coniella lustricola]|uniref:Uncharacterized protein n=1 Tax=Coniella lustricola TaxID=2025994 RepID=A0A2T3AED4_9PEZI|nr:hypothetical protein BD289DRAFT_451561 [Coniella lustricola]